MGRIRIDNNMVTSEYCSRCQGVKDTYITTVPIEGEDKKVSKSYYCSNCNMFLRSEVVEEWNV